MKKWLSWGLAGALLFFGFLVLSFPFDRLGPKISSTVETALTDLFRERHRCHIVDFGLAFPLGVSMESFECQGRVDSLFKFNNVQILVMPFFQSLSFELGEGSAELQTNSAFGAPPTRLSGELQEISVEKILPIVLALNSRFGQRLFIEPKLSGSVTGNFELPLQDLPTSDGTLSLKFQNLKLPSQPVLDWIGLRELRFEKSLIQASISDGILNFEDAAFLSSELSAKVEGSLSLAEPIGDSTGDLRLKWRVKRSDAILSSDFGPGLLAFCPSPDAQGFCTQRATKLSDLTSFMPR